jgi:hypothetical protein
LREIESWSEGNGTWFEGNRLVVWGVISRGLREIDSWFEGNRLVVWGVISRGLREVLHSKIPAKVTFRFFGLRPPVV